jgi:phosphonate degradation associated HDIG domain protein
MALSVNDIFHLLSTRGHAQYGGESVSQLEHALQCAQLAEENNEAPETIVAALLHDLGHLIVEHSDDNSAETQRRDDLHQFIALPFLSSMFPDAVLEPIRLHVDAKRYLCATDAGYWQTLSPASKSSLELQGGVYTAGDAATFITQPFAEQAVRLRRYDDLAKVPHRVTRELFYYRHLINAVSLSRIAE